MTAQRRHPRARGGPRARCLALLFLVLGGVFAMHGLGSHGVAAAQDMPAMGPVTPPAHSGHAPASMPVSGVARAPAAVALDPATSRGPMVMAGSCVAILVGAAVSLLALRRTTAVVAVPALRASPRPVRIGRPRDPPCPHALSVHRC